MPFRTTRSGGGWRTTRLAEVVAAPSLREVVAEVTARLTAAGVDAPRLDAELLLAHALGVGRERLVLGADDPLEPHVQPRLDALVRRRAGREPLAYIVGRKAFRHIELEVDRRVLIPRPETELLVEAGLGLPGGSRVVDVGTGSGAVALALKHERPDLRVAGTDVSADALDVARANAARLGLEVRFAAGDLLAGLEGPFDGVLANLPYVAEGTELAREISLYEPMSALYAGPDGLDAIRRLIAMLDGVPWVALEVGFDQADAVAGLLAGAGFAAVERLTDLAGHERVVVGRR
jgi:release factor glutamine methyltransferase